MQRARTEYVAKRIKYKKKKRRETSLKRQKNRRKQASFDLTVVIHIQNQTRFIWPHQISSHLLALRELTESYKSLNAFSDPKEKRHWKKIIQSFFFFLV